MSKTNSVSKFKIFFPSQDERFGVDMSDTSSISSMDMNIIF